MGEMLTGGTAAKDFEFVPNPLPKPGFALSSASSPTGNPFELLSHISAQHDWASNAFLLCADGAAEIVFACGESVHDRLETEKLLRWADECQLAAPDAAPLALFSKIDRIGRHMRRLICIILPRVSGIRSTMLLIAGSEGTTTFGAADGLDPQLLAAITGYVRMTEKVAGESRQARGLVSALNCIDIGMCVIDAHAKVMFSNLAADRILSEGDGLGRRLRHRHRNRGYAKAPCCNPSRNRLENGIELAKYGQPTHSDRPA